jgi:hypothetical protein
MNKMILPLAAAVSFFPYTADGVVVRLEVRGFGGGNVAVPASSASVRSSAIATAANSAVRATVASGGGVPQQSSSPRAEANTAPSSGQTRATPNRGSATSRSGGTRSPIAGGTAGSSAKDGLQPTSDLVYEDPGRFILTAEAGWASKHVWRGIDIAHFTSYNHLAPGATADVSSDITFFGVNAAYKGFSVGLKYIESIDDNFNPFYAPLITTTDSYQELILSANYTRVLLGEDLLVGTLGVDFYHYGNGEFWGVEHQGMVYAKFSMPRYELAQPFIDLWYNVPTTTSGEGLAAGGLAFRGSDGADLVEGWGSEIGVRGSKVLFSNDSLAVAASYSGSAIYKSGYAFEDDGFSHLVFSLSLPVSSANGALSFIPTVSYAEALQDIADNAAFGPGSGQLASAWNEPEWFASVRGSWSF